MSLLSPPLAREKSLDSRMWSYIGCPGAASKSTTLSRPSVESAIPYFLAKAIVCSYMAS